MSTKLSVIIPAFNEERFLARTLTSLADQTWRDCELLVIDNNASADATRTIVCRITDRVILEARKGYMNVVAREGPSRRPSC